MKNFIKILILILLLKITHSSESKNDIKPIKNAEIAKNQSPAAITIIKYTAVTFLVFLFIYYIYKKYNKPLTIEKFQTCEDFLNKHTHYYMHCDIEFKNLQLFDEALPAICKTDKSDDIDSIFIATSIKYSYEAIFDAIKTIYLKLDNVMKYTQLPSHILEKYKNFCHAIYDSRKIINKKFKIISLFQPFENILKKHTELEDIFTEQNTFSLPLNEYKKTIDTVDQFKKFKINYNFSNADFNVLITGPVGTGKTTLIHQLIHTALYNENKDTSDNEIYYKEIASGEIQTKYKHSEQNNINKLGENIENFYKCVKKENKNTIFTIIINEAESLLPHRNQQLPQFEYNSNCTNAFLVLLDQLKTKPYTTIFMLTSNFPEKIDPGALRKGRINNHFILEYPDESMKYAYCEFKCKKLFKNSLISCEPETFFKENDIESKIKKIKTFAEVDLMLIKIIQEKIADKNPNMYSYSNLLAIK